MENCWPQRGAEGTKAKFIFGVICAFLRLNQSSIHRAAACRRAFHGRSGGERRPYIRAKDPAVRRDCLPHMTRIKTTGWRTVGRKEAQKAQKPNSFLASFAHSCG